ncbi:MAG: 4'-phosphopantetheinyl transferase superfamily protein [Flavobacteriaceae bacterium]|nr:4'-phosphopantetheinyl transferase superfamily protein [Bacteroidia bacterium]MBT8287687.1 4'-phosphopantetheinyl transferase superfamily protein [Bacteroidia bacterium]NNF73956.1 4'-phosphopantetheinyl transferase superfamily protein [Flavobacteriaceae bacterium]NNK73797.1 4'-phosphopantetheinyl transferase superfamily protein [Flavobacteriaceae bacterium]
MPLYKTLTPDSSTTIKLWKITESFEDLNRVVKLRKPSRQRVESMKSEIHQRGFLSIRHLLRESGYTDKDLYYDKNGKPHLTDGKYISISHSFNFSGIVVSDHPVGIDIERQREKIKRIVRKFSDYELNYLNSDQSDYVRKLTVIWCIKESLYKLYAQPGLSFKDHTLVIPFNIEEKSTRSWIDFKKIKSSYQGNFFEFEGFTCAYVLP